METYLEGWNYIMPDRNKVNFIYNYIDKNVQTREKNLIQWVKIVVCIFLFMLMAVVQGRASSLNNMSGIINGIHIGGTAISGIVAQFQVMISVYLVVSVIKKGYVIAVILNMWEFAMVFRVLFWYGDTDAAPGIIIPMGTLIVISIIYLFGRRLNRKIAEVIIQKEELVALCEEITASEEELFQQNEKLKEYNLAMKENEEKLNNLAFFDVLTGLPNRKMLINQIDILIKLFEKKCGNFVVVFIDLDNFKNVNDSMGHHVGDLLLQNVASKLKAMLHSEDMLGRLGGDEFALIIQKQLKEEEILEYIERLRRMLVNCFYVEKTKFSISASFGISIYPQDGNDSAELLKCADMAMYKAKNYGKNCIRFFSKEMREEILKKIEFENGLLSSIKNKELFLEFQPQYSSGSKGIRGFEALVRWNSPKLGVVRPLKFIPIAEETRFIIPMGEWIIRTACEKFKYIKDRYDIDAVISVNISAVQIMEPSFIKMVKKVLDEIGLEGKHLEFEITESVFISARDYIVSVLSELRNMGISIALDDFGTGYSSLSYLQELPINILKIDKSFVDSINQRSTDKQIVGSIISLVHQMDISVVAEGVENEMQLEYLKNQACDCIQGFLWGKPLNEEDLNLLLGRLDY